MITIMKSLLMAAVAGMLGIMAGCGGGGGGTPPATTKVAGTVSKGILSQGSASIYAVDAAGVRATAALKTVPVDTNGQFNADIGVYRGAIVIEATGTYIDEATGDAVVIGSSRPMRAAVDAVGAETTRRFAVTPLTDLAHTLAGTPTPANIAAANARVSDLFKISDITGVEPVQANAAALGTATIDQQAYTLALATLSQMARSSNPGTTAVFSQITTQLDSFATDLAQSATSGLGSGNRNAFASALATATSGSLSGFSSAIATLGGVGTTSLKLTVTVTAPPAGTRIGAIQGTIAFPAGTSVRVVPATNGEVLAGMFSAIGGAGTSLVSASFAAQTLTFGLIDASGFDGGDFAALTVDVSSGSPTAASFAPGNLKVFDTNGVALTGLDVTLK